MPQGRVTSVGSLDRKGKLDSGLQQEEPPRKLPGFSGLDWTAETLKPQSEQLLDSAS